MRQCVFQFMVGCFNSERVSNELKIAKGQLVFLEALLSHPDRVCTLDDGTSDLAFRFDDDGGKWRGHITLGLWLCGLIESVGAENSKRPSRNRGLLRKWRCKDDAKARRKIEQLKRWIDQKENPQTAATVDGQKNNISKSGENENAS